VSHLGPRVSAYVDGQMPATEAEYAQAHLAMCPECQAQVLAEGASRRAARQAQPVRAGEELTQRLLALGAEPQQDYLPEGAAPAARPRRGHGVKVLTGALASLSLAAVALFVLGGTQHEVDLHTLVASDAVGTNAAQAAPAQRDSQLTGTVLEWMRSSGWAAPRQLPAGLWVQDVRSSGSGADTLRLALGGEQGQVSVVEQHGVLSSTAVQSTESEMIGGREVYRIGEHSWVVQCGDSVVGVNAPQNPDDARALIANMPTEDAPDVLHRMAHGFDVLVGRE